MTTENQTLTMAPAAQKTGAGKIVFIDHIKVLLIVLVILHHTLITYGASGSWYFQQKITHLWALFPMTVFVATDQAFFMGFFFFISALFVAPSYNRKGPGKFLTDRLKRLGIPLVFYSLVLSPVMNYTVEHYGYGQHHSFIEYMSGYRHWVDFGVLWFVAALLIFNFIYLAIKQIPALNFNRKINFPDNRQILFAAFLLGLFTFLTRLVFHVGWTLSPLGFQLGHFPQYVLMFIVGIVAFNNKWLDQLDLKQGKRMARIGVIMVTVLLPAIFIAYLAVKPKGDVFSGGLNAFSFTYSFWEQITGITIMTAILCIAKFKWNSSTKFMSGLAASAFGVYIFHPVVLITLSLLVSSWAVDPVFKLLVVAPLAVVCSFAFVSLLRKIPFVKALI